MKRLHLPLAMFTGLVLLTAAVLKWFGGPIEGWGIWPHRALILSEVVLGLGLLSGLQRRAVVMAGCVCFAAFASVNMVHIAAGRSACGCFGTLEVNPWITLTIDLALMAALGWSAVTMPAEQARPSRLQVGAFAILALGLMSATLWPSPVLETSASPDRLGTVSGKLIVLEPERWAGKPFALADFISNGKSINTGRWVVLLYHNGCSTCTQALRAFRQTVRRELPSPINIALIEVPPHEVGTLGGWGTLNESLSDSYDWFATTPVAIAVEDGIVKATVAGEAAIDAGAFLHRAELANTGEE